MNITTSTLELAKKWPGKIIASQEHPAIWHMIDVASCAECLIQGHGAFVNLSERARRAFVVLAALHDVGKISESFRGLIRDGRYSGYRHWQLSDLLLTHTLDPIIEKKLGGDRHARGELYAAVSGHHGGPERTNDRREINRRRQCIGPEAEQATKIWLTLLLNLFPDGSLTDFDQTNARRISWALSGLTIASDWVASNEEWFRPESPDMDLYDYYELSRKRAKFAVARAGLGYITKPSKRSASALTGLTDLHPMQQNVEKVTLPSGSVLILIEDTTGSGKTESALIMAHRLIVAGRARGLFFALPTMATANAMFDRMMSTVSRLFGDVSPTVSLSHGQADLHFPFNKVIGADIDPTPEAGCTRWLADDRRRSLLAEVGVGTIDQALMSILPTRFSTLRLFGLTDRVLVVDEAHAYDPYMQRQLETLLHMQAMNGGSAIVMTATLPLSMRKAYIRSFKRGLKNETDIKTITAYPCLTIVGSGVEAYPIKPTPATSRTIEVKRIETCEEAVNYLVECSRTGAACLWVRNSVDEAILAVEMLRKRQCNTQILHARFTYGDRLHYENIVMNRYGYEGVSRQGNVLVATQIVETSLDLDFDVMVTDLAPIGALIQRSGRLWRHMGKRPACSRPVDKPLLAVLSPNPDMVEDENWLCNTLGRGSYVYRHDYQWKTARVLFEIGVIDIPTGLRQLIEAVHGQEFEELPMPLSSTLQQSEGSAFAEVAQAQHNVVIPEDGYLSGTRGRVWSEEKFPTRLGQEDATLVLARHSPTGLIPWCEANTLDLAWALSEVRCNRWRLPEEKKLPDQNSELIDEIKREWSQGKKKHLILCPVTDDGIICDGLRYDSEWGLLFV